MSEQAQGPFFRVSSLASLGLNPDVCQLDLHQRVAALSAPARLFHRAVLRAFLEQGRAPTQAELRPAARLIGIGLERLLADLVVHDVIQRAADGTLQVAYPFSGVPTLHRVEIDDAPPVFAMCAIDALGLPFMVGRPATIHTQDPTDATPLTIAIEPISGAQRWHPATTVVLANECSEEPAIKAECACPFINAFASPETADRWRAAHPELVVKLLTQEQALEDARKIFGTLLEEPPIAG
ncbi:MAG TPA: alkylmercury lyase family protein [Ktedonobacterales bacterium]